MYGMLLWYHLQVVLSRYHTTHLMVQYTLRVLLLAHAQEVAVSNNHENSLSSPIIIIVIPSSILSLELLHPPLPFTWTRTKQNERGFPHRRHRIFFWSEKTSKTRRVDLSDPSEQKIVTSVSFLGRAHLSLQTCGI